MGRNVERRYPRIDGDVVYIPLTMGCEAIIDVADLHLIDGYNWTARRKPHCKSPYAFRTGPRDAAGRRKFYLMHRVIMGDPVGFEIDHIDGNGLNNRRSNLRVATRSQNQHNRGAYANNSSGFKGVGKSGNRWVASIRINGQRVGLGSHETAEAAHAAYCAAAEKLHKDFARTK